MLGITVVTVLLPVIVRTPVFIYHFLVFWRSSLVEGIAVRLSTTLVVPALSLLCWGVFRGFPYGHFVTVFMTGNCPCLPQ